MSLIREWCHAFVSEEYSDEIGLFHTIWERVEEFRVSAHVHEAGDSIPKTLDGGMPFDSEGKIELRTTWIALTVPAVLGELGSGISPTPAQVEKAVRNCSLAFGASKAIAGELADRMAGPLARVFDHLAVEYEELLAATGDQLTGSAMRWIEWCERQYASYETPDVHSDALALQEVEEKFRRNDAFWLHVDEEQACITIQPKTQRGRGKTRPVAWSKLTGRQEQLLGLFLTAFRDRQPVRYDKIASLILKEDGAVAGIEDRIHQLKSQLDKSLHSVLGEVIKASKGGDRYEPVGQIPYCWIRRQKESSRLR